MKIYFTGSITAGRHHAEAQRKIIKLLSNYGTVLTEHIGNLTDQGEDLPAKEIFNRDVAWLKSSDLLVAEISTPSSGVGYEIGIAESENIPIICCYKDEPDKRCSAMIEGNKKIKLLKYHSLEDLERKLKEKL